MTSPTDSDEDPFDAPPRAPESAHGDARDASHPHDRAEGRDHPYSRLTPDCVLDALEEIGYFGDGRLLALNSYENRVYRVNLEEGGPDNAKSVVAKFYRPERWSDAAILEEHGFVAELAAAEIPVVPPLADAQGRTLHHHNHFRFAVFPTRGGRSPEIDDPEVLEWIGRFIGRIHAVGVRAPYRERISFTPENFGHAPRAWLLEHGFVPADLRPAWEAATAQALEGVQAAWQRAGNVRILRLHGDCHPGNILWTEGLQGQIGGPHFVDFDDSCMGPAIQDLWMLLSGTRADMTRQLADVLAGYEDFMEFDPRELHLVEALRTLRLLHYSAWLARRWHDPAFPAAFPWFNTQRYWEERVLEMREQIALMSEPPLWPA